MSWSYTPGGDVLGAIQAAADRGVYAAGELILTTSTHRVPIEEGTLERSGAVSKPQDGKVTISYDTPYAVRQHEDMTLRHDAGRQAKFLESAMCDEADTAAAVIAQTLRKALGT